MPMRVLTMMTMHVIHTRLLLASLLFSCFTGIGTGQDQSDSGTLTSMAQVMANLRVATDEPKPAAFEATVTFWDPARQKLFVEDDRNAIYVKLLPDHYEQTLNVRLGSRVKIQGHLDTRRCLIFADQLELIAHGAPPLPIRVDTGTLKKGAHWSRRVEIEGEITSIVHAKSLAAITIVKKEKEIVCNCLGSKLQSKTAGLLGSKIRVVGVMDWDTHESGAPRQALCQVASFSDIELLSKGGSNEVHFTISTLAQASTMQGSRIQCHGIVTFVADDAFLLEDENSSLLVRYSGNSNIELGSQLEVEGRLQHDASGVCLQLENANDSDLWKRPLGVVQTNASQIAMEEFSPCRVSLQGTLLDFSSDGNSRTLNLKDRGLAYQLRFNASDRLFERLKLRKDQEVGCQGLATIAEGNEDAWFVVRASSVNDVWSASGGIRISQTEVFWWIGVCSTLLLLAIVWSAALRGQVKRKTKNLAAMTSRLNASYEAIDEGILLYDSNGIVLSCNRRFRELTGLALSQGNSIDVLSRHISARFSIESQDVDLFESNSTNESATAQLRSHTKPLRQLVAYVAPVKDGKGNTNATLLTLNDVTKQQELEAALVQSQKMEAVGQLAGGVAHDFNNLLMVIVSSLDLARLSLPNEPGEVDDALVAASQASERAAGLVKNLLGFSRLSALEIRAASLNTIAMNVATLIRRSFKSTIRIETEFDADLQPVKVDPAQIEQVLMNVCLNARDALKHESGQIRITTRNLVLHDKNYAMVSVEDDGVGMSQDVSSKMFEPFYTTKATGEGTGLGMSMSYGIVSQHGGWIDCDSQPGRGSRISVVLPQNDEPGTQPKLVSDAPISNPQHAGRVLVIDDDDAVRRSTCSLLDSIGFDVDDIDNGIDGLKMLSNEEYELLVLDLNMPLMSGQDVCAKLADSHPQLPVIICTGYLTEVGARKFPNNGQTIGVLQKPFRLNDLQVALAETLGSQFVS